MRIAIVCPGAPPVGEWWPLFTACEWSDVGLFIGDGRGPTEDYCREMRRTFIAMREDLDFLGRDKDMIEVARLLKRAGHEVVVYVLAEGSWSVIDRAREAGLPVVTVVPDAGDWYDISTARNQR